MRFWGRKVYGGDQKVFSNGVEDQSPLNPHPNLLKGLIDMKISEYKSYDDLPLFLNATIVAKALGIAPSSAYELMHEANFPVLKVGSRLVVPKDKFIQWIEQHTEGGKIS